MIGVSLIMGFVSSEIEFGVGFVSLIDGYPDVQYLVYGRRISHSPWYTVHAGSELRIRFFNVR